MIEKKTLGIIALLLFLTDCVAPPPLYQAALESEGEIRLYLQPMPQEAHRLEFDITAISAVRHDGVAIPLSPSLTELKGRELVGVQKRLASGTLPPGLYDGVSIQIGAAALLGEEETADLLVPDDPLLIPHEFTVVRRRASALFLSLSPEKLFTTSFSFTPAFSLASPRRQLRSLLGFATNSQTNIVSVFNKHTMEVVDTIATSSGPKGAAIDQRRGWVYVALAGDDAIEAIRGEYGGDPRQASIELRRRASRDRLVTRRRGSSSPPTTVRIVSASSTRSLCASWTGSDLPSEPTLRGSGHVFAAGVCHSASFQRRFRHRPVEAGDRRHPHSRRDSAERRHQQGRKQPCT